MLGTGAGVAFMSKGLLVPSLLITTCVCLLLLPAYRRRTARIAFAIAVSVALPWLVIWPVLVHATSPDLFDEWLWTHNIGRFLGSSLLGGNHRTFADRLESLLLIGFPALLLFLFVALRTYRGAGHGDSRGGWNFTRDAPGHVALAVFLLMAAVVLGVSASVRDVYFLPMLPSVVLLGLPALGLSPARASGPVIRFASVAFGTVAAMIVAVWFALVTTGNLAELPGLGHLFGRTLPLPYRLGLSWPAFVVAVAAILVWIYILRRDVLQSVTIVWCAGFAMIWVVTTTLLLPWIDAARSYRELFSEVESRITPAQRCVATVDLGESELAMFEYVTGVEVTRAYLGHSGSGKRTKPNPAALDCDWLLALSHRAKGLHNPDGGRWTRVWSSSRPADKNERFTLYRSSIDSSRKKTAPMPN